MLASINFSFRESVNWLVGSASSRNILATAAIGAFSIGAVAIGASTLSPLSLAIGTGVVTLTALAIAAFWAADQLVYQGSCK